jgi:hypothetical protein
MRQNPYAGLEFAALVKIRMCGDAYIARCSGKTCSCTSAAEFAAAGAAAKHFNVPARRIRLHANEANSWLALPDSAAPADWPFATDIVRARQDRMLQ